MDGTAKQSVCLLDWDGTLRQGFVIYDWVKFLVRTGVVEAHNEDAMTASMREYRSGTLPYEAMAQQVVDAYARALAGVRRSSLTTLIDEFWATEAHLFEFTRPLIDLLREKDIEPIVISGSPKDVVQRFAEQIGVSRCHGLELRVDMDGIHTGAVDVNMALADSKRSVAREIENEHLNIVLSFGDSVSDEPLFEAAKGAYCIAPPTSIDNLEKTFKSLLTSGRLHIVTPDQMVALTTPRRAFW